MAPDPITNNRRNYAKYSESELNSKKFKTSELRNIASSVGIRCLQRGEIKIYRNLARKAELAKAIAEACEAYKPKVSVDSEEKQEAKASTFHNQENERRVLANKYYSGKFNAKTNKWEFIGFKECVTRAVTTNKVVVDEFFILVASLKSELEAIVKSRSPNKELIASTLSSWKSDILKRIEKRVNEDASQFPDNLLKEHYSRFYDAVQAIFQEFRREKVQKTTHNLNLRENQAIDIKVSSLVLWAIDQVTNLPESSAKWKEVAIAIMILTGRRQSEVMSSGKFYLTDSEHHLIFTGQLKRHDDVAVDGYEIPILGGCATGIINAINWLEMHGKREKPDDESLEAQQKAAKKAHNRFSRYLSEAAKKVSELIEVVHKESWVFTQENGKIKDRRNCHMFRQIYGQCVIPVFFPSENGTGRKANQILTDVMGHSSSASSRKHAAESYDADVKIEDVERVKQIAGF